jgi:hypothetical protein
MILEGQTKGGRLAEMAELLKALRALAGAATARSLADLSPDEARSAAIGRKAEVISNTLRQPSTAEHASQPPSTNRATTSTGQYALRRGVSSEPKTGTAPTDIK